MDTEKALAAAERVMRARAELKAAEEEFAAIAGNGKSTGRARPAPKPVKGKGSGGPSVSQRVLGLVLNAGPLGIARGDIVAVVGKKNEVAVHSALKVHSSKGRVENKNGRWMGTAKYIKQLQSPTNADAALLAGAPG